MRKLGQLGLMAALLWACGGNDDAGTGSLDAILDADGGDTAVTDTNAPDAVGDSAEVSDTTPDTSGDTSADTSSPDGSDTAIADTSEPADTVGPDTDWPVDPTADWALGRPMALASSDGAGVAIGAPVLAAEGRSYIAVRLGSGSLIADGRTFAAPDDFAHALILRVEPGADGVSAPRVLRAVYVDGALSAPELPRVALCEGKVYATVNDSGGQVARLLELSADLESVRVSQFAALPTLGSSVRLGAPVCGGPGFVVGLDAVGGAVFTGYDNRSSQFSAEQTMNRTLIVNGAKIFGDPPAAQTVSAVGMRIIHMAKNTGQKLLYVGEATIERTLGENTQIVPGDQLVYQHDFATASGGTIASQGFFGREDVTAIAGSFDGRFAVAWLDVETDGGVETTEVVLSVFSAEGARLWTKRAATWAVDAMSFGVDGHLRVAGRFRSLEHLGVAAGPVGFEDSFLAVLDGQSGERIRHVTRGWAGLWTRPVGGPTTALGERCGGSSVDAVVVRSEGLWEVVGVSGSVETSVARCGTKPLQGGRADLMWGGRVGGGGFDAWVVTPSLPDGLYEGAGDDTLAWPSGQAVVGPVRGKLVEPL